MVRDGLVAALEESLRIQQQLVDNARDDGIPVADLLAQILTQKSVLERLDRERDELINQLRLTASHDQRAGRTGPPIRDVVLQSLADFRWPAGPVRAGIPMGQSAAAAKQPRSRLSAAR